MPLTDPQLVIRRYFDPAGTDYAVTPANITDDRGVQVTHIAVYAFSEALLTELFLALGYGLIFVVDKPSTNTIMRPSGPVAYRHTLMVTPVCIDKWTGDGNQSSIAITILNAATQEIRKVVRENMTGSLRVTGRESTSMERIGSLLVWGRGVEIAYTQPVTSY
jgi:hypothetical protein